MIHSKKPEMAWYWLQSLVQFRLHTAATATATATYHARLFAIKSRKLIAMDQCPAQLSSASQPMQMFTYLFSGQHKKSFCLEMWTLMVRNDSDYLPCYDARM